MYHQIVIVSLLLFLGFDNVVTFALLESYLYCVFLSQLHPQGISCLVQVCEPIYHSIFLDYKVLASCSASAHAWLNCRLKALSVGYHNRHAVLLYILSIWATMSILTDYEWQQNLRI